MRVLAEPRAHIAEYYFSHQTIITLISVLEFRILIKEAQEESDESDETKEREKEI